MKRKLIIAGVVVAAIFVTGVLVLALLNSSRNAAAAYNQVTLTPDGKVVVQPPVRLQGNVTISASQVSNIAPPSTQPSPR